MNDRNKKTFTIIALAVAILLIGVGYAFLQQDLIINGTANIGDARWLVEITGITMDENNSQGASLVVEEGVTNPSYDSTTATFNVDLEYPGAYAEFDITVENKGNIDAILNSITGVEDANKKDPVEIQYEVTGVTEKVTTLDAGETNNTNNVTVKVTWVSKGEDTEDTIPETPSKTATITLNYIQNTGTTNTEGN